MMRAILFTALGYWFSRELYERYDKKKQAEREQAIEKRLIASLKKEGLSQKKINQLRKNILTHEN